MENADIQIVEAEVAQVIDDELMLSSASFQMDMSGIQQDVAQLTEDIDEALTVYGDLLAEPSDVQAMGHAEARRCERALSSAIRAAEQSRRKLGRDYRYPLDAAKKRYDELMEPVIQLHALYKARRAELDDEGRAAKKQALQHYYEQAASFIAIPLNGQDEALVPFDRLLALFGDSWLNKGTPIADVTRQLDDIVSRIVQDEHQLDAAGLKHAAEAKSVFWQSLDLQKALARDEQLCQAEQRQAALEAARAQAGQSIAAPLAEATPPAREAPPRTPRVMLIDGATDDECRQIGAFCKSLGIHGTFKGPAFHESVRALLK